MTDVIRLLGNSDAHDDVENDAGFVDTIDEFFHAFLDHVYVQPSKIKEIQTKFEQARKVQNAVAGRVS